MSDSNPTTISHKTHLIVDLPEPDFIHRLFSRLKINPDKVYNGTACWEWQGMQNRDGYGAIRFRGKMELVHRIVFALSNGAIPRGLRKHIPQIDHLCRNRKCAVAEHLNLTTPKENVLRSDCITAQHARQTRCKRGHRLTERLIRGTPTGHRACITCQRADDKRRRLTPEGKASQRRSDLKRRDNPERKRMAREYTRQYRLRQKQKETLLASG